MRIKKNRRALLPWLICAFCVISATIQAAGWVLALEGRPSLFDAVEGLGWGFVMPIVFAVLAALILTRQPSNTVGWLMMIPAISVALLGPLESLIPILITSANPGPGLLFAGWAIMWAWVPILFPVILIPLHFPTGALPSPRWRVVDILAIVMVLTFTLLTGLAMNIEGEINREYYYFRNPIGFVPNQVLDTVFSGPWSIALVTLVLLSVASLFVRYRHEGSEVRLQMKWLLFGCLIFGLFYSILAVNSDNMNASAPGWSNLLLVLTILTIPVSIAIAILRYRLYDIDVIIRKTLLYAILTALLALVYFGIVLLLQSAFGAVAGEQSPAIIVISTLVIAALFAPLRRRVQEVLDRRFFRKKYDAQQVLAQFALTARDEVDTAILQAELLRVVQETLQPENVSIQLQQRWSS